MICNQTERQLDKLTKEKTAVKQLWQRERKWQRQTEIFTGKQQRTDVLRSDSSISKPRVRVFIGMFFSMPWHRLNLLSNLVSCTGHVYCISDCGGAMEEGTCPECHSTIGGQSHRLRSDNQLASEMDGARHAAWSEIANLRNFAEFAE